MAIETPEYRVLEHDGAFELREYAPYLLAETRVDAGFMNAGNIAFGRLFRYISGANTEQRRIAMTAPVEQAGDGGGGDGAGARGGGTKIAMTAPVEQRGEGADFRVGFVVPRQFDRDSVPQPTDPRIEIRAVPARRVAAWRYTGRWTEANFREHEALLRERIAQRGLEPLPGAGAIIARYDPPFMVWFLRRNEVLIPVRPRG